MVRFTVEKTFQENRQPDIGKDGMVIGGRGADEVIQPELDVAERLSRRLSLSNITDIFEFRGSAIADVLVPSHLCGKPLKELDLRNKYNITILLMRKSGSMQEYAVGPDTMLECGDQLTVFGEEKAIIELFKER